MCHQIYREIEKLLTFYEKEFSFDQPINLNNLKADMLDLDLKYFDLNVLDLNIYDSEKIYHDYHTERIMEENSEEIEDVLGHYERIRSPGKIILHRRNIIGYTLYVLKEISHSLSFINFSDVLEIAKLIIHKIYIHEHFHLFSDIQSYLNPNYKFNRLKEEALAVAFSFLDIREAYETKSGRINKMTSEVYRTALDILFNYKLEGYRDWIKYDNIRKFEKGLEDYFYQPGYSLLIKNLVPVGSLIKGQLDKIYECGKMEDIL